MCSPIKDNNGNSGHLLGYSPAESDRSIEQVKESALGIFNDFPTDEHFSPSNFNGRGQQISIMPWMNVLLSTYNISKTLKIRKKLLEATPVQHFTSQWTTIAPDKNKMGILEANYLSPVDKRIEVIDGIPLELTYHSRTGKRSCIEITGGPKELVGYTTKMSKCDGDWEANGIAELNDFVQRSFPDPSKIPMVGSSQIPEDQLIGQKIYSMPQDRVRRVAMSTISPEDLGMDTGPKLVAPKEGPFQNQPHLDSNDKKIESLLPEIELSDTKMDSKRKSDADSEKTINEAPNKDFPELINMRTMTPEEVSRLHNLLLGKSKVLTIKGKSQAELGQQQVKSANNYLNKSEEWKVLAEELRRQKRPYKPMEKKGIVLADLKANQYRMKGDLETCIGELNQMMGAFKVGVGEELTQQMKGLKNTVQDSLASEVVKGIIELGKDVKDGNRDPASLAAKGAGIGARAAVNVACSTAGNLAVSAPFEGGRRVLEQFSPEFGKRIPPLGKIYKTYKISSTLLQAKSVDQAARTGLRLTQDYCLEIGCGGLGVATAGLVFTPGTFSFAVASGIIGTGYTAVGDYFIPKVDTDDNSIPKSDVDRIKLQYPSRNNNPIFTYEESLTLEDFMIDNSDTPWPKDIDDAVDFVRKRGLSEHIVKKIELAALREKESGVLHSTERGKEFEIANDAKLEVKVHNANSVAELPKKSPKNSPVTNKKAAVTDSPKKRINPEVERLLPYVVNGEHRKQYAEKKVKSAVAKENCKKNVKNHIGQAPEAFCGTLGGNLVDNLVDSGLELGKEIWKEGLNKTTIEKTGKVAGKVIVESGIDTVKQVGAKTIYEGASYALKSETAIEASKKTAEFVANNLSENAANYVGALESLPDLGTIMTGYQVVKIVNNARHKESFNEAATAIVKDGADLAYSTGCSYAGMAIGASIGSLWPGPGTYVGGIVGSGVGRGVYHTGHWVKNGIQNWYYGSTD